MRYSALRAPAAHLELLIEPPLPDLMHRLHPPDRLLAVRAALDSVRLLDTSLAALRRSMHARLGLPESTPVILTGHQAEFFHAGVFVKRLAADAWARSAGAGQVFLSVDSDTPKTARIATANLDDGRPVRHEFDLPACDLRLPVEHQPAAEPAAWADFFRRLEQHTVGGGQSLLPVYARDWLGEYARTHDLAAAFISGNVAVERALGLSDALQLRVSTLSTTPEFRIFAAHLLLHAAEFRTAYNAAQADYRLRHQVRNPARPAPPLSAVAERVETPFWLTRPGTPRARLFVAAAGDRIELFADDQRVASESRAEFATAARHAGPWACQAAGWELRPRALTLSGFCRLVLCDLFIHGIGGAKYDELTDDFCRAFFGQAPGAMVCVTATAHLDLPAGDGAASAERRAAQRLRDLRFNPQRYVRPDADVRIEALLERRWTLVERSEALRAMRSRDRAARRSVYHELHATNAALLAADPDAARRVADEQAAARLAGEQFRVARDREYFYALHSGETLRRLASACGVPSHQ